MKQNFSLLPHEQEALSNFRLRLKRVFKKQFRAMRLFGSKARGTDHVDSDVDVLVLLDVPGINTKIREVVYDLAWQALHEKDVDISPLIYSTREYKDLLKRERLIALTIEKEGVPL